MKTSMRIGSAIALALLGNAAAAAEAVTGENEQAPATVYGKLNLQYEVRKAPLDDGIKVGRASVGVKGPLEYGNVKALYDVEAEFSDIAAQETSSDNKEVRLRTAQITIPTKKYGVIAGGRGYSGQRKDLYGHLDIFENTEVYNPNNGNYYQGSDLTAQTLYVPGFLLWKTPSIGHVYAVPGLVTTNDGNGKAIDATSWRVMYDNKGVKAGVGVTKIETGANDYTRTAAALSYTAERWQAGVTREQNKHSPSGDFDVTAVGASYKFTPKVTGNLAYFKKDHKTNAAADNTAVISNVTYALGSTPKQGKSAKLFLEHEEHDIKANTKTTAGISLAF